MSLNLLADKEPLISKSKTSVQEDNLLNSSKQTLMVTLLNKVLWKLMTIEMVYLLKSKELLTKHIFLKNKFLRIKDNNLKKFLMKKIKKCQRDKND